MPPELTFSRMLVVFENTGALGATVSTKIEVTALAKPTLPA